MNPRFVAVSGPFEGQSFTLTDGVFSLGRHKDNHLVLSRLEVSRFHCRAEQILGEGWLLTDLDSLHGTFVNRRPIRHCRLKHGDLIGVGDTHLLFLSDDPNPSGTDSAEDSSSLWDSKSLSDQTLTQKPSRTLHLDDLELESDFPERARLIRDLHVLLGISTAFQETLEIETLACKLLDFAFQLVPAESGAVFLREPGLKTPERIAERLGTDLAYGCTGRSSEIKVSNTVIERVLEEVVGVCHTSLEEDSELMNASSVMEARVQSLLCVPLVGHGEVLGVVYVSSRSLRALFDKRHLELVTAIAGIASLAFENANHLKWLRRENRRLREDHLEHDMIGESTPMRKFFDMVMRVAPSDSTVLIRGESGTGKELAAQAIHRSSHRSEGPMVAVNCATFSETLLESELFGHERGAFTGAVSRKIGKMEAANTGTLFLDEVGEIPPAIQAKLLRALQEREIERVGGTRPIPVDVRILAATHRDLEAAIAEGTFREDLYYRLKVISCTLPPLRQRRDDIPLLASHFASRLGRRQGRNVVGVSPEARRCLLAYDWPGNVRELANVIERAVVLGHGEVILPEDLPDEVLGGAEESPSDFHAALTGHKKHLVLDAYRRADGDYAAAADLLGVHVNSLHRMIRTLGLKPQLGR